MFKRARLRDSRPMASGTSALAMEFNPLRNGFDEFLGIPYSNDNSKYHPDHRCRDAAAATL